VASPRAGWVAATASLELGFEFAAARGARQYGEALANGMSARRAEEGRAHAGVVRAARLAEVQLPCARFAGLRLVLSGLKSEPAAISPGRDVDVA
jgi:hypothetical protein